MTTQRETADLGVVKERQQRTWSAGDYTRVGNPLVLMGENLVEAADVRSGQKVLDVATGSGNTALSAARRFCETTGVDYVPDLIERARQRAAVEGLEAAFDVGDAEKLPYPDASFDVVLSTIGVMFAPDQDRAASELLRVCRPGGRIGLANWTPDSFVGALLRTVGKHVPPPPGVKPPLLWGTEERLRELLGDGLSSLDVARRSHAFRYPSAGHFIEHFRSYYGPMKKAFESLDPSEAEALESDLRKLLADWNASGDETIVLPSEYLEVVAVRR